MPGLQLLASYQTGGPMRQFAAGAAAGGLGVFLLSRLYQVIRERGSESLTIDLIPGVPVPRPRPSGELIVSINQPDRLIVIFTSSDDATIWITDQSPLYGTLFDPEDEHGPFVLLVSPFYDPLRVAHYLYAGYHEGVVDDNDTDNPVFA